MGKRGPGDKRLREAARAYDEAAFASHPWEKEGMPEFERVIAFLESLPIVSGLKAGEKLELLDFQRQFVTGVYEPRGSEGQRLVRLAALSVGRGNGKSGLLSGLGLAHLLGPCAEPYGECYAAALDREQAGVLYRQTRAYIEGVPWMAARVHIKDFTKTITDEENQSIWSALTSDARKAHGLAPSFWIADEVAQWKSRELWDNLRTGTAKRESALGVSISTQARNSHHFFSEILDADPTKTTYSQLHTAPKDCDLDDVEAWKAANPALGIFLNETDFADQAALAKRSNTFAASFRNHNLNQRVDSAERFIAQGDWEANGGKYDLADLEGELCFGGLDLSSTRDLTAFALYFPEHGKLWVWHWIPAETIQERAAKDKVPYDVWVGEGWMDQTTGRSTDREAIALRLEQLSRRFDVQGIAFDPWRIEELERIIDENGISLPLVKFVPGYRSYAPAVDAFERALLDRKMRHADNPVLRWQAGNVIVDTDEAGNRKPLKKRSIDRIDGICSTIMACGLAGTAQTRGNSFDDWLTSMKSSTRISAVHG